MPLRTALLFYLALVERVLLSFFFRGATTNTRSFSVVESGQKRNIDAKPNTNQRKRSLFPDMNRDHLNKVRDTATIYKNPQGTEFLEPWPLTLSQPGQLFTDRWKATSFYRLLQLSLLELVRNGTFSKHTASVFCNRASYDRAFRQEYGDQPVCLNREYLTSFSDTINTTVKFLRDQVQQHDGNLTGLSEEPIEPFAQGLETEHVYIPSTLPMMRDLIRLYGEKAVKQACPIVYDRTEEKDSVWRQCPPPDGADISPPTEQSGWTVYTGRRTGRKYKHFTLPFLPCLTCTSEPARQRFMYAVAAYLRENQVRPASRDLARSEP